jgi:hypothetical protein
MLFSSTILMSFAAIVAAFCGAPPSSQELRAAHAAFAQPNASTGIAVRDFKNVVIDTYAHVISSGSLEKDGNIPQEMVTKQVRGKS